MDFYGYGWYLSSTAALLYTSWQVHNAVAWIKIKPFLSPLGSKIYIGTVALVTPLIILQIVDNFRYFNNISELYLKIRPYEPLFRYVSSFLGSSQHGFGNDRLTQCRDPWWIFTCSYLLYMVRSRYSFPIFQLLYRCPRFTIMLLSMALSIIFIALDIVSSVVPSFNGKDVIGINPYWKVQLVFKCFADTVILDDFRTALERLRKYVFNDEPTIDNTTIGGEAGGFGEDSGGVVGGDADIEARKRRVQRRGGSIFDNSAGWRSNSSQAIYHDPAGRSRAGSAREAIGKVGMKISRLPMLGGGGGGEEKKSPRATADTKSSSSSSSSANTFAGDEKPSARHLEEQRKKEREQRQKQRRQSEMGEIRPQKSGGQMSFEDFLKSDQAQFLNEKR